MSKRTSRPAYRRTSRGPRHNPLPGVDMGTFLDRVDNVQALLSEPGRYYTTSGQQAFAVVKALAWHPLVLSGEENFFVEGSVLHFTVLDEPRMDVGTRPAQEGERDYDMEQNPPTIGWGTSKDYYERRVEAYDKWELAWWREVVQNSRDARASRIDLSCEPGTFVDPDTGESVPCMVTIARDNGTGMDAATLQAAFFTRGGSVKEAGAVGGFGDAKELILTPWLGYEVRTRDLVARGRHEDLFAPGITAGQPRIDGTEVKVWMPLSRTTSADFAASLLERSYLPGIVTTVNGKRVAADLMGGGKVLDEPITVGGRQVGRIEIYHQPRARRHGVYVRGNGVFMFERGGVGSGFKGVVYVDIKAPPRNVFTRKRDALSWESSARDTVEVYLEELAVDPMSKLKAQRAKESTFIRVVKGAGALSAREGIAAEVAAQTLAKVPQEKVAPKKEGKSFAIGDDVIEAIAQEVESRQSEWRQETPEFRGEEIVNLTPAKDLVTAMLSGMQVFKTEQVAAAVRFAAWKPDFIIVQELPGYVVPKKLDPQTMAPKYLRLVRLWAELCKYALIQLGMFKPFGVGWIFDTETDPDGKEMVTGAAFLRHEGMEWLLLNPVKLKKKDEFKYDEERDHYDLSEEEALEEICASVIHEVTHMQGYSKHDQAYAYALTENIKIAFGMKAAAKKILKAVNALVREEVRERKTIESQTAELPWLTIVGRAGLALYAWDALSWDSTRQFAQDPQALASKVVKDTRLNDVRDAPAEIQSRWQSVDGPLRSDWPTGLKPKQVLAFHDAILAANPTFFESVPDEVAADMATKIWRADRIPLDPREKRQAPTGVYTWVRQGNEFVLRAGYAGQRGELVHREPASTSSPWDRRDQSMAHVGRYLKAHPEAEQHPYAKTFVFEVDQTGRNWRFTPPVRAKMGSHGETTLPVDVSIKQDKEGFDVYAYDAGPKSRYAIASLAEAQMYVLDWLKENAVAA